MPRPPTVWPRKGTPWHYTTIAGEQVRLSQNKKEAEALLAQMLADRKKAALDAEPEPAVAADVIFRRLADEYLKAIEEGQGAAGVPPAGGLPEGLLRVPETAGAGLGGREERLQPLPLGVGQVGRVRLPYHARHR